MQTKKIKSIEVIRPGSAPDIDTDFHTEGRAKAVQHIVEKYGRENISNIITFGTFQTKNSLKSMATIYQIPATEANRITKLLPKPIDGKGCSLQDIFNPDSERYAEAEEFRRATDNDKWREVIRMAMSLVGRIKETGIHACGIIMSSKALSDTIPTQVRQNDGTLLTQWTYPQCEALGLIKMDFLGLDTLDIMQNTLSDIQVEGKEVPDLHKLVHGKMDDKKTYKLLQNAETTGIFQLGSSGMRDLLERVKPTKFEDIAAITALYRPGPMKMNSHIQYADRKNGREKIEYIDPEFAGGPVEEVLKPTYGLCVPANTPIYDGTRSQFVPIKYLNPMTSTTPSINPDSYILELKPVSKVIKTGYKDIVKITRADGHSIRVSKTHPILTDKGYVNAGELKLEDKIAINQQEYPTQSTIDLSKNNIDWLTGLYLDQNWKTYEHLPEIENYNTKSLIGIIAGVFSSHGSIDKTNGNATFRINDKKLLVTVKKILTILAFRYTISELNDETIITINKNDFLSDIAFRIPSKVRPKFPGNKHLFKPIHYNKSGVDYIEISNIENDGKEMCYDIEVKDNHNFLIDNVVVHNCIYQEQCMQLAQKAAGMSSYKADKLRKAMGKKKMKIMMGLKPEFISGVEAKGYSSAASNKLWETIKQFGQYGFNKSHSISYAINAYKTCYLKANYPVEFMSALIQQNTNETKKIMLFLQEAKRMGIKIGTANINQSQAFVAPARVKNKYDILYGFSGLKQVSGELSNAIIENRKNGKYKSVGDFIKRLSNELNAQSFKSLALSGAFDEFHVSRKALFDKTKNLLSAAQTENKSSNSLFDLIPGSNPSMIDSIDLSEPEYSYTDLIKKEAECIGIFISGSPTQNLGKLKHIYSPTSIKKIESGQISGEVNLLATFTAIDAKTRKNGSRSIAVRLDDDSGYLDLYLPNNLVKSIDKGTELIRRKILKDKGKEIKEGTSKRAIKLKELIEDDSISPVRPLTLNEPYVVTVKASINGDGDLRIFILKFKKIITAYNGSIPLSIAIPSSVDIKRVEHLFEENKGETYVRAFIQNKGWRFFKQRVKLTQDFIENLGQMINDKNILTKGV